MNHFLELQKDENDNLWVTIHSGSRNLGAKVCKHYNTLAEEYNKLWQSEMVEGLAYLPLESEHGKMYFQEMEYCVDWAVNNRRAMMKNVCSVIDQILGASWVEGIECIHNFAEMQNVSKSTQYMVHRKGAIEAYTDVLSIIPGSMGTCTYIVEGLSNKDSFISASHGAGRPMSRSQANKTITLEAANKSMEHVVFGRWGTDRKGHVDVSESPLAYKDINVVMDNQKDLVKPIHKLLPIGVLKG